MDKYKAMAVGLSTLIVELLDFCKIAQKCDRCPLRTCTGSCLITHMCHAVKELEDGGRTRTQTKD